METVPGPRTLRVIDSWRVADGRVLAFRRHRERFRRAVEASFGQAPGSGPERRVLPDEGAWEDFWGRVRAGTPRAGEWFPRASARLVRIRVPEEDRVRPCVEFDFELRPAPPRRLETRLTILPDARALPEVKGADAAWCAAARARAQEAGADDALLVDGRGRIAEAAHGAVLGWRDGVCLLPPREGEHGPRRLQSVTVAVLAGLLPRLGVPLAREALRAAALGGAGPERVDGLWYVNALHGVSPVTAVDGRALPVDAALARTVRRALESRRVPL
ncbi:MAG: aminotransferase class IV [Pseudoclavibacter sp.]|nr:aminotransferase class IV [Pseudoclavibacter sp.]